MAQRSFVEVATGAVVLLVAAGFLGFAMLHGGRGGSGGDCMLLRASFDRIDGLTIGADVRLAGVKIGTIDAARIDAQTFQAIVTQAMAAAGSSASAVAA